MDEPHETWSSPTPGRQSPVPSETQEEKRERDERARRFAAFLRARRKDRGWSSEEAAAEAGIVHGTYQTYERSGRQAPAMPRLDTALMLMVALRFRIQDAGAAMGIPVDHLDTAERSDGEVLRRARESRRWSQSDLAGELVGVTVRMIQKYEAGEVKVPPSVIKQLVELLTVRVPAPGEVDDDVLEREAERALGADEHTDALLRIADAREPRVDEQRSHGDRRNAPRASDDD